MSRVRRMVKRGILILVPVFALALIIIEWQAGVFIPAPRIDLATASLDMLPKAPHPKAHPQAPSVRVLVDPSSAEGIIVGALKRNSAAERLPGWVIEALIPYEAALVATFDFDRSTVHLEGLLNMRRLDGVMARAFPMDRLHSGLPEIEWSTDGIRHPRRGLLTLHATVPMDPGVEEDVWYFWDHDIIYAPLELEGGHLLEAVFDNRSGGAWLVIGSLFTVFDFDLDEQEQDISLSSLQFVTRGRCTLDVVKQRDIRIQIALEIIPQHVEKLGVINLKIGLSDAFDVLRENLQEDHNIEMTGGVEWDENVIRYDYLIRDAERVLAVLLTDGQD